VVFQARNRDLGNPATWAYLSKFIANASWGENHYPSGEAASATSWRIYTCAQWSNWYMIIKEPRGATVADENAEFEDHRLGLLSDALSDTVSVFRRLDDAGRQTLLKALAVLFGISVANEPSSGPRTVSFPEPTERFSKEQSLSPKEFLLKKQPQSDVERVACLGYYLAHYRDQQQFNTRDISALNTEAAQRRFSNAAVPVSNATNYGYLVPGIKGMKQLSAGGEMYVEALPDRDAANEALAQSRPKRASKKSPLRKKAVE